VSLQDAFDPPSPPTPPAGHGLLVDKVVIVTAAAGTGIGSATARRCLEEGASLVVSDAHARRLGETAEQLEAETGGVVRAIPCDVTDEEQVQNLYAGAIEHFGRFDVAVHNAGLGGTVPLVEMTDAQWSTVLDITLTGTFRCTRAALTHLLPHRQQRLGSGLAGPAGAGPLRRGQSGCHGADPVRRG
jgi:3-oxoacyl-[acyl-carrier protein] reductase